MSKNNFKAKNIKKKEGSEEEGEKSIKYPLPSHQASHNLNMKPRKHHINNCSLCLQYSLKWRCRNEDTAEIIQH